MFRARQCTTEIGTWCLALLPSLILLSVWFIVSHHGDKIPLLLKSQLTSRSQIFQFRCFRDASLNISAIFGSKRLVLWGLCLCSNMGCNHAKAPGVEDRTIPGTGTNVLDTISWFIEKKKRSGCGMKDDKKMPSYRWWLIGASTCVAKWDSARAG